MEEISTFIWIGIGLLWILTRLIRRGAGKSAGGRPVKPAAGDKAMPTLARHREPDAAGPAGRSSDGGTTAKPIEPR